MLKIKKWLRANWILVILLVISLLLKLLIVFYSPLEYIDSDEAFQGVITKHIVEKGEYPYFTWNASYGGDVVIQLYIATLFYILFGVSALSLKLSAITTSLIVIILGYFFIKKFFSKDAAILTILLLAIPTTVFLRLSLHVGYHLITVIFDIILIYIFYQIFFYKKFNLKNFALFGFLSAIAFYASDSVIVLFIAFFIFWFIFDKLFFIRKQFFTYISSFLIGSLPLIYFNLTHNFSNIKHLFSETIIHRLVCKYNLFPNIVYCLDNWSPGQTKGFAYFFTKDLPNFFGYTNLKWIYYFLLLISLVYILYNNRKHIFKLIYSLIHSKRFSMPIRKIKLELFLVVYVLLYLIVYYFRGLEKSRYLYGLYLWVPLIIVLFILDIRKKINNKKLKILAFSLIILLLVVGLIEVSNLISGNIQYNSSKEENVYELIDFLNSKKIEYVYTDLTLRWFLVFESNEEITASCNHMCYCGGEGRTSKYPAYDAAVDASDNHAYIVREGSTLNRKLMEYLTSNKITYKKAVIDNKLVYYSFSKDVRPKDAMVNCTTNRYIFE